MTKVQRLCRAIDSIVSIRNQYNVAGELPAQQRKGTWQKALLAAMVKKHCAVSNEWIAKRLEMGHPAGMSKLVKFYQESKEGIELIRHYEKILKSKD